MDEREDGKHPATAKDHRANNLDFLRLFFAVLVLYSHSYSLYYGYECDPLMRWTHGQISFGQLAVNGFFSISGYLITISWLRSQGLWDFAVRRALRIYPGFIAALLVGMLVVGPLSGVDLHAYFHDKWTYRYLSMIFLTYLQLPGTFPRNPVPQEVNGSLWTIRYEIVCYMLVAALGVVKLLRREAVIPLWIVVMAAWAILRAHATQLVFIGAPSQLPRLTAFFVSGMIFALWQDKIRYSGLGALACAGLLIVANYFRLLWYVLPLLQTYIVFFISFDNRIRLQNTGRYGDFSYGAYLFAFPIQQLLICYFRPELEPLTLFVAALPLTLIAAFLSWRLVEKPALSLKSHALRQDKSG